MPLSYWLLLWAESSAEGVLVFCWGETVEGGMEPLLVVLVDLAGGGVLDIGDRLVGAVIEGGRGGLFGWVEAVVGLH